MLTTACILQIIFFVADERQRLVAAIDSDDETTAIRILDANPTLARRRTSDEPGFPTMMDYSVSRRRSKVMAKLLELGAVEDLFTRDGINTPAEAALSDKAMFQVLLKAPCDLKARRFDEQTLLHQAAWRHADPEVFKSLIKYGFNVNAKTATGDTALEISARLGRADAVKLLLELGADVRANEAVRERSIVDVVLSEGHNYGDDFHKTRQVVEILVRAGSPESLHMMVFRGDLKGVKRRLDAHTEFSVRDKTDRMSLLHVAAVYSNAPMVRLLLDHVEKVYDAESGQLVVYESSPLEAAIVVGKLENARVLADRLHPAERKRIEERETYLGEWIKQGLTPNWKDRKGLRPIHKYLCHHDLIETLCREGADPNAVDANGWAPLHFSEQYVHASRLIGVLVANGASLDLKNNDGDTALHLALSSTGNKDAVSELVRLGARTDIVNKKGETAEEIARRKRIALPRRQPQ